MTPPALGAIIARTYLPSLTQLFFPMKFYWSFFLAFSLTATFISCSNPAGEADRALAVAAAQTVSVPSNASQLENPVPKTSPAKSRNATEMVAAGFKRYGIEKGIIIYRLDGAINGTEFIYFDHWGWREAHFEDTESDLGDFHEKTSRAQYLDGERRYVYDPTTKTATYFDSPQIQTSAEKWGTKDMVKVGVEMLKNMGGRPDGTGKVGDIECDVWQLERIKTTLWMWQGLTLAEKSFAMNLPVTRRAISVKTDVDIPLEKLLLPPGTVEVKME